MISGTSLSTPRSKSPANVGIYNNASDMLHQHLRRAASRDVPTASLFFVKSISATMLQILSTFDFVPPAASESQSNSAIANLLANEIHGFRPEQELA